MTNEKTEVPGQEVLPLEPGLMLKQKRESRDMSVSDVAERLHITVKYVEALESDNYEELPGDTFVRGYLRAYARLLGLDPAVVIEAANALIPGGEKEKSRRLDVSGEQDPGTRKRPGVVLLLSGAVGLSLAIAAVTWWRAQQVQPEADPVAVAPAVAEVSTIESGSLLPKQDMLSESDILSESDMLPEGSEFDEDFDLSTTPGDSLESAEAPVAGNADLKQQKAVAAANTGSTKPVPSKSGNSPLPAGDSQDIIPPNPVSPKGSATKGNTVTVVKTPAAGNLSMQFVADCWVKITDLKGKVLYVNMQKANTSLDLQDLGAVKLILGNVQAVSELRFNDKRVALDSTDGSGNVARLTLGLNQG